jgi:hypothetical protein
MVVQGKDQGIDRQGRTFVLGKDGRHFVIVDEPYGCFLVFVLPLVLFLLDSQDGLHQVRVCAALS